MVEKGLLELKELVEKNVGHVCIAIESEYLNLLYTVYNDEIIVDDNEIRIETENDLFVSIPIKKEARLFKDLSETNFTLENDCMNLHFDFIGA